MKENIKIRTLEEVGVIIIGGQIMTRITAKEGSADEVVETRRVVIPKCISGDGSIRSEEMPEEALKTSPDPKRLTEQGDIVVKLSTPYDAAMVDEKSEGCVVPSFCAIIKETGEVDPRYLLAFLNSRNCKEQLKVQVAGSVMTVLSVGKIKGALIPIPSMERQIEIGEHFLATQRKLRIVEEIVRLEQKKNDVLFQEMVKNDDE